MRLIESLPRLKQNSIQVSATRAAFDDGSVLLAFSSGAKLEADYWRLLRPGKTRLSNFDHGQIYGLPKMINAVEELKKVVQGAQVIDIRLEIQCGDLILQFADDATLELFIFSGYEVWEISFPDGTVEYSNFV